METALGLEAYRLNVTLLAGVLSFGYLFGTLASHLANSDSRRATYA